MTALAWTCEAFAIGPLLALLDFYTMSGGPMQNTKLAAKKSTLRMLSAKNLQGIAGGPDRHHDAIPRDKSPSPPPDGL
jgi:hypothetical protein